MPKGLDFYYSPTPNGWKVSIMLEECGLSYNTILMDLNNGDQFHPNFLRISPNNRMPAIVDYDTHIPTSIFESGAILIYLAEKTGKFLPNSKLPKKQVMEWLFWQVGNLGPMGGQHSHFWNYAPKPEKKGYAAIRYAEEYDRCFGVLERQLNGRKYLVDEYSIADIICWPWVLIAKAMGRNLDPYPNVVNWRQRIKERPAVQKGVDLMRKKS